MLLEDRPNVGRTSPDRPRVGWLLAIEPLSGEGIAWTLFCRRGFDASAELVGSGLREETGELRRSVDAALPHLNRAGGLWSGALVDPDEERDYAVAAGSLLLPPVLRECLLSETGSEHLLSISTRGWVAAAPWDSLAVDGDGWVRLIEAATVVSVLPAAVSTARRSAGGSRVLKVIDPGPPDDAQLPPIYPGGPPDVWYELEPEAEVIDATAELDADGLADLLPGGDVDRLFYWGHVRAGSAAAPAAVALVLDDRSVEERFTAYRWLAEPDRWPAPRRVALIGCGSNDSQYLEQSGLAMAAGHAGAELVTVTRWTVPIDHAGRAETSASTALALAVDRAHASPDAIAALRRWQLERLHAWRRGGERADAPILWAALCTWIRADH